MLFTKSVLTLLATATSALAITITGPSASSFWVQNTSNIISWTFNSGDPNPIDITVTNSNTSAFSGPFSIARFVDLNNGTFTVTNVTLNVGSGYVVNFVNSTEPTQVFASSASFDVRPAGTPPATTSAATGTATSPGGTGSGTGTATGTGSTNSSTSNASPRTFEGNTAILPIALSFGMTLMGALITF